MATNINYNIHTQIDRCISDYIPLIINMVCVMYGIVFVYEREKFGGGGGSERVCIHVTLSVIIYCSLTQVTLLVLLLASVWITSQ